MTIRRDNVEYHQGYRDFGRGVKDTECPYNYREEGDDCRYNRWQLGWIDAKHQAMWAQSADQY
jgi:hypothetical protein